MSTETTAAVDRSTELVNRLLKLPEQTRLDLANLLLDRVRKGFTSLEEAANSDKRSSDHGSKSLSAAKLNCWTPRTCSPKCGDVSRRSETNESSLHTGRTSGCRRCGNGIGFVS